MPTRRNYKEEYARWKELHTPEERRKYGREWMAAWKKNNPKKYRAKVVATQPKRNEAARKYRATEKGKRKSSNTYLRANYNISIEDYEKMFAEQRGLCFVCKQPERRIAKSGQLMALDVDHNHQTGEVRKLLCHACNVSIGFLDESSDRMRALADYIESFQRVLDREGGT